MDKIAGGVHLAFLLALPKTFFLQKWFGTADVGLDIQDANHWYFTRSCQCGNQPRAGRKQGAKTIPIPLFFRRTGDNLVQGLNDAIDGADILWAGGRRLGLRGHRECWLACKPGGHYEAGNPSRSN